MFEGDGDGVVRVGEGVADGSAFRVRDGLGATTGAGRFTFGARVRVGAGSTGGV